MTSPDPRPAIIRVSAVLYPLVAVVAINNIAQELRDTIDRMDDIWGVVASDELALAIVVLLFAVRLFHGGALMMEREADIYRPVSKVMVLFNICVHILIVSGIILLSHLIADTGKFNVMFLLVIAANLLLLAVNIYPRNLRTDGKWDIFCVWFIVNLAALVYLLVLVLLFSSWPETAHWTLLVFVALAGLDYRLGRDFYFAGMDGSEA